VSLRKVHLQYEDRFAVGGEFGAAEMRSSLSRHQQAWLFVEKALIVEAVSVEVVGKTDVPDEAVVSRRSGEQAVPVATVQMYTSEAWQEHRCISGRICNRVSVFLALQSLSKRLARM